MKLHERVMIVERAHNKLATVIANALEDTDITYVELWDILNRISASYVKYAIRQERHPDDPEKRGGEE